MTMNRNTTKQVGYLDGHPSCDSSNVLSHWIHSQLSVQQKLLKSVGSRVGEDFVKQSQVKAI